MAATGRKFVKIFRRSFSSFTNRDLNISGQSRLRNVVLIGSGCGVALGTVYYWRNKQKFNVNFQLLEPVIFAKDAQTERADVKLEGQAVKKNIREERFLAFGSLEFDGNVYMTPEDFLESVTEPTPRARTRRRVLNTDDVDRYLNQTPKLHHGTSHMFRKLNHKGLISYTEYLFLLCVLTKPQSGFQIAFNMFDTDGNQMVEKREFLVLSKIFLPPKPSEGEDGDATNTQQNIWDKFLNDSNTPECEIQDTTLLRHFFGAKGTGVLKYQDFAQFMDNLQTEVLELEFNEFSRGMATISEAEFAKILMRYTKVDHGEHDKYITRVEERIGESKGIKFDEFKKFFQFLNNLDDFTMAMRFFTFGNKPVSQEEFQRAVDVCVGYSLSPHLLNTVFTMFDDDGDGHLTHGEFISIMKDRVHRGVRTHLLKDQTRWEMFRACVKNEMRKP